MGWIQRELGEYGVALALFQRARPLGMKLHGDAAEIDADLGDVYLFSGDSERARALYLQALQALKGFAFKTVYSQPPGAGEMAETFRKVKAIIHARDNLGALHYFAGDHETALGHLQAADALIDKVLQVARDPFYSAYFTPPPVLYEGIGFCRTMMGAVYGEMGRLDEAWSLFDAGRRAFRSAGKRYGLMVNQALRFKVEFLPHAARLDEDKLAQVEALLDEAEGAGALEVVWRVCFELGRAMAREGENGKARAYLARSVDALEKTRSRLREDTIKKMFASSVQDVYEEMIELLFTMGAFEEGFDYLERAKARAFLDMLAGRSVEASRGVDPLLAQKERDLQARIDVLARKLRALIGSGRKAVYEDYQGLVRERARVLEAIKDQSLEYAATTTVTTVPAGRIAARLDDRSALVSYFVGRDRVLAWVVRKEGVYAAAGGVKQKDLARLVADYRHAVGRAAGQARGGGWGRPSPISSFDPSGRGFAMRTGSLSCPAEAFTTFPSARFPSRPGAFWSRSRPSASCPTRRASFFWTRTSPTIPGGSWPWETRPGRPGPLIWAMPRRRWPPSPGTFRSPRS